MKQEKEFKQFIKEASFKMTEMYDWYSNLDRDTQKKLDIIEYKLHELYVKEKGE